MSTYREIVGKKIKKVSSDPSSGTDGEMWYNSTTGTLRGPGIIEAFASGGRLATGRFATAGAGSQTAALVAGGYSTTQLNLTEEYNGLGWGTGGTLNQTRYYMGGAGTQTAALAMSGRNPPTGWALTNTEEYNGTAWTATTASPTGLNQVTTTGTQTAALLWGGVPSPGAAHVSTTFELSSESWTAGGALPAGLKVAGAFGTQTAAMSAGNETGSTLYYDGSSWSDQSATVPYSGADYWNYGGTSGTQTAGILMGGGPGASTTTAKWDGSTWSSNPAMATARAVGPMGPIGTSGAGLIAGGDPAVSATEEFNSSTTAYTAAAWASGGTLNTGRQRAGGFGNAQTAAVVAAGASAPPATAMNKTEEYNGTSWTEVNAVNTARYNMTAFGTEPAGVLAGVGTPTVSYGGTTEEYDGTNWTTVNSYNAPGANYRSSCGPQTAGLLAGGVAPAPAEMTNAVEEYDGTNWTNGTNLPQYQSYQNMAGTQTAAINGGGNKGPAAPGPVTANTISLEYDGSSWTAGPNANLYSDRVNSFNGGSGTQASALFVGGDGTAGVKYDGTTFATDASYPAARGETNAAGLAPSTAACIFAGGPVPSVGSTTLEYSGETTTINIKNFTTS